MKGKRSRKICLQNKVADSTNVYPKDCLGWDGSDHEEETEKKKVTNMELEEKRDTDEEKRKKTKEEQEKNESKPDISDEECELWEAFFFISVSVFFGTETFRWEAHKTGHELQIRIACYMSFIHLVFVLFAVYLYLKHYVFGNRNKNGGTPPPVQV